MGVAPPDRGKSRVPDQYGSEDPYADAVQSSRRETQVSCMVLPSTNFFGRNLKRVDWSILASYGSHQFQEKLFIAERIWTSDSPQQR
jgi:hypothetical protein